MEEENPLDAYIRSLVPYSAPRPPAVTDFHTVAELPEELKFGLFLNEDNRLFAEEEITLTQVARKRQRFVGSSHGSERRLNGCDIAFQEAQFKQRYRPTTRTGSFAEGTGTATESRKSTSKKDRESEITPKSTTRVRFAEPATSHIRTYTSFADALQHARF